MVVDEGEDNACGKSSRLSLLSAFEWKGERLPLELIIGNRDEAGRNRVVGFLCIGEGCRSEVDEDEEILNLQNG